ncbi:MAG: hypothetical protein SA339_08510 [Methanomassiliicoccus sp.]|nr:hypothetical protein [Methanomassiliicoccus sp.]
MVERMLRASKAAEQQDRGTNVQADAWRLDEDRADLIIYRKFKDHVDRVITR